MRKINYALNKYYALNRELRLTTSAYGIRHTNTCLCFVGGSFGWNSIKQ